MPYRQYLFSTHCPLCIDKYEQFKIHNLASKLWFGDESGQHVVDLDVVEVRGVKFGIYLHHGLFKGLSPLDFVA